jgi:anaerobic ribonucleoside-triphosphate reductase activating protein
MARSLELADGLTVSGGEPFDQPEALEALLRGWRAIHRGDVLVYSGYPFERIAARLESLKGLIDVIIADPLQLDVPQTMALRGSDNQRLVALTETGRARFAAYDRPLLPDERQLDIMFDDTTGDVYFAGIPRRGDMTRLAALLAGAGHHVATTEDKNAL